MWNLKGKKKAYDYYKPLSSLTNLLRVELFVCRQRGRPFSNVDSTFADLDDNLAWVFEHQLGHCERLVEFLDGTVGENNFSDARDGGDVAHRKMIGS